MEYTHKRALKGLSHKRLQKSWNKKMDAAQVSLGKKYAKEHGLKKEEWTDKARAKRGTHGFKPGELTPDVATSLVSFKRNPNKEETKMTKKIDEAKKYLGDPAHAGGYISALRGNQPFNNPHKKGSSKAKRWFKGLITAKLKNTKKKKTKK